MSPGPEVRGRGIFRESFLSFHRVGQENLEFLIFLPLLTPATHRPPVLRLQVRAIGIGSTGAGDEALGFTYA